MKKTKRFLAMLLALVMVFALCACGSTETASAGSSAPAASAGSSESATAAAPADDGVAKTNRVIGTNQLLLGAYPLDIITTAARAVSDICGEILCR